MSRKKRKAASIDAAKLLNGAVRVKVGDRVQTMSPIQAEFEQLATLALGGCVKSMCRFLREALRLGVIEKAMPELEYPMRLEIPKDWDRDEFMAQYEKYGFPPWPGPRDGLTEAARKAMPLSKRRSQR